jgi:hypothetical protein
MGFLKDGVDQVPQSVQQQTNDFLWQPYINIHSVGQLRGSDGRRAGMMMLFEVEDRSAAEAFIKDSPYLNAGLYGDHHLYEFLNEVG